MRGSRLALAALCLASPLTAQQPDIGTAPGRLVDVGGRKLHLLCSGQGSPTVVIEAGASSFAIDFTLVQREVERTDRVCSYDRAGTGWSDPSTPATRASESQDLHELLEVAGEHGPFVLVGASRGGLLVRAYLADHPAEVAGLVLIDPSSEDRLYTMFNGEGVLIASLTADQLKTTFPTGPVPIPRRNPQTGVPFDKLPADLYQLRIKLDQKLIDDTPASVSAEIVASSQEGERAFLAKLLAARSSGEHPLGDLPMVVLSRGVESDPEPRATHAQLANLSNNSRTRWSRDRGTRSTCSSPARWSRRSTTSCRP